MARHVLNAKQTGNVQLPMFMRAGDITQSLTGTLDRSWQEPAKTMRQKLNQAKAPLSEAHGSGVYESVEREGVLNPVQLVHGMNQSLLMGQGHHRTAVAADIERQTGKDVWVPVVHTDAREGSDYPVDEVSDVSEKRAVIADYRIWSQNTKAIGQDAGWQEAREDAEDKRARKFREFRPPSGGGTYEPVSGT